MENLSSPAARRTKHSVAHWMIVCATAAVASTAASLPAWADQNEGKRSHEGKRAPTVLATPPFFLEANQIGSCALVNLGTVPLEVTLTYHEENTTDRVTTFTIEPTQSRARRFDFFPSSRSLTPVPAYCKFVSTDTSLLRAGGYAAIDAGLGSVRAVAAE
jgi:hypothetical protein